MPTINEPLESWGGNWTKKKLDAFESYVNAYLTIMNAQKRKYNGWPTTVYFDGFAGSGERISSSDADLFSNHFTKEDMVVYKGSVERVLRLSQKFDQYIFVDNDKKAVDNLKHKLSNLSLISNNCYFISDDVNNQLNILAQNLTPEISALVLLDPFGMQIDWSSIENLKDKRVDLWILIPSGVIINRLLDKKGKLMFPNKLQSYFGLTLDEIRKRFYETETIETLFGITEVIKKASDSIYKIAEVYVERLKSIWQFVTNKPLILYNTRNVPIYHFVFASNNQTALKIASQIIEKKNK